ncbi:Laminin subunit alpha-2 [Spatholobus suberectus]|nr:Laminin subunit alpha-2 [Spatholobus suberectus]
MERQREQISQDLIQIENLKDNLAEMKSIEQNMVEEKEGFLERIKGLELNLETGNSQKNELEEKLRDASYEIKQLVDENKALQNRNHELRTATTQKGEEISNFLREHENHKNGASMEVMSLNAKLNGMRLELDTMHEQKSKLEQQNERSQREYAESIAKMETLNAKLATQIADQERTMERLNEENRQAKTVYSKLKLIQGSAERKMNEQAEEFRRKMEDNIRLLHQRIHVAEQLNNENKHSCKLTKLRYEEENKILGEKIASYEEETAARVPNLNGLDLAVGKVEEHARRVTGMVREVEFVKDWARKRNGEVRELRDNVDGLKELLGKKEEQELLLRENVWNLEAKVSKEGGEKLNLRKEVSQLEKKVGKLEKSVKDKDEELTSLGEKKREAIRQLCFVVDFHRDRYNYLKDMVTKMRANKKT